MLAIDPVPLALPPELQDEEFSLYLQGSFVCFGLIAVLPWSPSLPASRAQPARTRFRARRDPPARGGRGPYRAHGPARLGRTSHELGTPLATLSVLVNDFRAMPELNAVASLSADLDDMENAVQRCKTIVSGILMSAGEGARRGDPNAPRCVPSCATSLTNGR